MRKIYYLKLFNFFVIKDPDPNKSCPDLQHWVPACLLLSFVFNVKYPVLQTGGGGDGLGVNLRSIVVVAVLMLLMMFAVHCTWVTSNAYSRTSIGIWLKC